MVVVRSQTRDNESRRDTEANCRVCTCGHPCAPTSCQRSEFTSRLHHNRPLGYILMPTSPRRSRAPRRFSSSSVDVTWNNSYFQPSSAPPVPRGRRPRRTSSVGRYNPHALSETSDHDEHPLRSRSEENEPEELFSSLNLRMDSRPMIYASLPPSPTGMSPTTPRPLDTPIYAPSPMTQSYEPPFSLWEYLREELLATDFDSHQELKWERVSNFLSIPLAMEKVSTFIRNSYRL